jgi:hypothetical protein
MPGPDVRVRGWSLESADTVFALVFILIYAVLIRLYEYHDAFAESDLYRMLIGLLDGEVSGRGIASPLHYDREFGFGYLSSLYAFVSPAALRDPDRLMVIMNQIGFWAMIPGLIFFWVAVRLIHGARTATVALIVMALGPMNPEMFTSGHPTIPMFAFLTAAAVLLFLPLTGWKAVLAGVAAFLLLLAGMTTRGEIFLAFPWLVLSRADTRSVRSFFISFVVRSIVPVATIVGFLVLQKHLQSTIHSELGTRVGTFFMESYSWVTVVPGLVYMALGCGIVTVLAAGIAVTCYSGHNLVKKVPLTSWTPEFLGPMALVLTPLVFFVPNPVPTRHFFLVLAGLAVLIGIALARSPAISRGVALGIALAIGAGNQVMAEVVRPTLVRINQAASPYIPAPEAYPTATHANLGWEWRRHAALLQRRLEWNALGDKIRTSCDARNIVLSDEYEQIFSRLYVNGTPVEANRINIPVKADTEGTAGDTKDRVHLALVGKGDLRLPGAIGTRDGKTFVMVEKAHAWPADAVAAILANPAYNDYKIIADPYTMSRYDKVPIPADRQPHFGCVGSGATQ